MRKCGSWFWLFVFLVGWLLPSSVSAFVPQTDPQYIVVNFSSMILLDWGADETTWATEVKPNIISQIKALKESTFEGTKGRRLAWSTLQEYMNTPLDEPSGQSYYAVKMRRIMDIAEELDFPLFIPLNGYQWWDELPELYNWWDKDGTQTPAAFFKRQRTADFKARFIAGFNPENRWNVEWQDYETPMKLNWRNWGGGGFRLAPPPNVVAHSRTRLTYRQVLESRLNIILNEIRKKLNQWEIQDKQYLFAGLSLGTEISLNASVTAQDEFKPYGYRAIQDTLCPANPTCGVTEKWPESALQTARQDVVNRYLLDLVQLAYASGIPKQRLYTHVWGEAEPGESRYAPYAFSAFTPYSRPGISIYSHAQNPFGFEPWQRALSKEGLPAFALPEYGLDRADYQVAWNSLTTTLDSPQNPAKMIVLYNWEEYNNTAALQAVSQYLQQAPSEPLCKLPEIVPLNPVKAYHAPQLRWKFLDMSAPWPTDASLTLYLKKPQETTYEALALAIDTTEYPTADLPVGSTVWYVEAKGCLDHKWMSSAPQVAYQPEVLPPFTVTWLERFFYWLSTWWPKTR